MEWVSWDQRCKWTKIKLRRKGEKESETLTEKESETIGASNVSLTPNEPQPELISPLTSCQPGGQNLTGRRFGKRTTRTTDLIRLTYRARDPLPIWYWVIISRGIVTLGLSLMNPQMKYLSNGSKMLTKNMSKEVETSDNCLWKSYRLLTG